jgi:hypothetical protein
VAAQAFDIQQGFQEQDELWLNFHVEAPGSLEQAQQEVARLYLQQKFFWIY